MRFRSSATSLMLIFAGICWHQSCLAQRSAPDAFSLVREPATIEERPFDPSNPPNPGPVIPPGLRAVTVWDYHCSVQTNVDYLDNGSRLPGEVRARVRVTRLAATLKLPLVIWVPFDANDKLRGHEYGHTVIDRRVYDQFAEAAAQDAASQIIGQVFEGSGSDVEQARSDAMHKAIANFCDRYHNVTKTLAQRCGARYDQLTDHGRNDVGTKEAVKQTIDELLAGGS